MQIRQIGLISPYVETTFILYASLAPNNNSGIKSAFWKIMTNTLALLPQPLPNPKLVIIKKSTVCALNSTFNILFKVWEKIWEIVYSI